MRQWQHLRLVEDHDAVRQIVQLPALRGSVGVHGFKQLHRRCHHNGHVPIFGGQRFADFFGLCAVRKLYVHAGMMLQHVSIAQYGAENRRILIDDGRIGNDVDDSLHAVMHRMPQRKAQRRNRLSAAGRHSKGVNAPRLFSCRQASIQYFTAQPVKLRLRILPWLNVFFQSSQQRLQIVRPHRARDRPA